MQEKHNVHSLELPLIQHVEGPDADRLSAVLRGMWFSLSSLHCFAELATAGFSHFSIVYLQMKSLTGLL